MSDEDAARTLFLLSWLTYAAVGPGDSVSNSNTVSRMGLVLAAIRDHALRIDAFAPLTIDKAVFRGGYYLDKAPGQSLLALPFVAAYEFLARCLGVASAPVSGGQLTPFFTGAVRIGAVFTSSLLTAAAAAAIYALARRCGASQGASVFGAACFAFCTPAFGWATVLFGHAVAGGLLFLAFAFVVLASDPAPSPGARRGLAAGLASGALLSSAVAVEFTSAPAALVIAVLACARLRTLPTERAARLVVGALLGGAAAAAPLALYNALAFGSVAHLGYSDVVGFDGMRSGTFGVSFPKPRILVAILIGRQHGIFWIAPLLALVPLAWTACARSFARPVAAALILVPCCYLLINSGYYYWGGGDSTGPRHIVPALPFVAFAFAPLWDQAGPWLRRALVVLAAASGALSLVCATVSMTPPGHLANPLADYLLPRFLAGQVHTVATWAGLPGAAALVALPAAWLLALAASWLARARGDLSASPSPRCS